MSIPSPAEVFTAFFVGGHQAGPDEVRFGPCDRITAEPEPEAEAEP